MWFKIIFCGAILVGSVGHADGPLPRLSDPVVVAAVPANAPPLTVIAEGRDVAVPTSSQRYLGGYPVDIAWDHVAVGATVLGIMYLLGEDAAAAGTF